MRRPHVEHHLFTNVVLGMAQLRIGPDDSRHRIGRFNLARCEGHGSTILSTLASQSATASVKWERMRPAQTNFLCRMTLAKTRAVSPRPGKCAEDSARDSCFQLGLVASHVLSGFP